MPISRTSQDFVNVIDMLLALEESSSPAAILAYMTVELNNHYLPLST